MNGIWTEFAGSLLTKNQLDPSSHFDRTPMTHTHRRRDRATANTASIAPRYLLPGDYAAMSKEWTQHEQATVVQIFVKKWRAQVARRSTTLVFRDVTYLFDAAEVAEKRASGAPCLRDARRCATDSALSRRHKRDATALQHRPSPVLLRDIWSAATNLYEIACMIRRSNTNMSILFIRCIFLLATFRPYLSINWL